MQRNGREVYLDHAATTPLASEVREKMAAVWDESWANASSVHAAGRRARREVEEARERVAASINAQPKEIVFTSGATEAINLALRGLQMPDDAEALLTSPLEHSAVLETSRALQRQGRRVCFAVPDDAGEVGVPAVGRELDGVGLVALMLVNNETGVRTDIPRISEVAHEAGALLFCDAVQAFGFEQLDVRELGVDALALSAHKAYGPKGAGVLWVRDGLELQAISHGGEQERGLRPGTLNVPAIAGFGVAALLARRNAARHGTEVAGLRDLFEGLVAEGEGVRINGASAARGPKHCSVSASGVDGEALLMSLDTYGVCASTGSACSAGSIEPSHVLTAMGLSDDEAKATVRFTFGAACDEEAVRFAADRFLAAVDRCRSVAL